MSTTVQTAPTAPTLDEAIEHLVALVNTSRVNEARVYVKELVKNWPESERVQHWDRVLEPPRILGWKPAAGGDISGEKAWLKAHAHEYPGCWIALLGDRMIAVDEDLDKVRAAARADGAVDPLFHFSPARWP
jgi:hypothetical protein